MKSFYIEQISGSVAILIGDDEGAHCVPRAILPDGATAGQWFTVAINEAMAAEKRDTIAQLMDEQSQLATPF